MVHHGRGQRVVADHICDLLLAILVSFLHNVGVDDPLPRQEPMGELVLRELRDQVEAIQILKIGIICLVTLLAQVTASGVCLFFALPKDGGRRGQPET